MKCSQSLSLHLGFQGGARYYAAPRPELISANSGAFYAGFGERLLRDPIGCLLRLLVHNVLYSFVLNGLFAYFILLPLVDGHTPSAKNKTMKHT